MASPAEEAARKQRKEEEAEIRRLKELGITQVDLDEIHRLPRRPTVPGSFEQRIDDSQAEEQAALLRNPNDQFGGTSGGTTGADIRTRPKEEEIQEAEIQEEEKVKGSEALGKISYGEDQVTYEEGEQADGAVPGETEEEERVRKLAEYNSPEQVKARRKEDKKLLAGVEEGVATAEAEGQKDVQRQTGEYAKRLDEQSEDPSSLLYRSPKDRRNVDRAQEQLDFLDRRDAGETRVQQTAADSPILQQHFEQKAAKQEEREFEDKVFELHDPDVTKQNQRIAAEIKAKNEALKDAGVEVDQATVPIVMMGHVSPGYSIGGGSYKPSLMKPVLVKDDDGNPMRYIMIDVPGARKPGPDDISPEEMQRRRVETQENRIAEEKRRKKDRARRGMIKTGDVHGLTELDRQTEEDAATRLRDAEAAIRADENLTANEQAVAIQELKNKGTLDVTESEVGGRSAVAEAEVGGRTAVTEAEVAGRSDVTGQQIEGTQTLLETKVEADETAAANLAETNMATASAQAEVDKAAAAVENEQDLRMQAEKQEHLDAMQDKLILAQEAEGKAQREADKARQEREIAEKERSQTSAEEAARKEGAKERGLTREAMETQREREDRLIRESQDEAIITDDTGRYSPLEKSEAEARLDASRSAERPSSVEAERSEGFERLSPVEATEYLLTSDPDLHDRVVYLADWYIDDDRGDADTHFIELANELRSDIASGTINVDNIAYVAKMLKSRFDPERIRRYEERVRRIEAGEDMPGGQGPRIQDAVSYLMEFFNGRMPINKAPTGPPIKAPSR